MKKSLKQKYIEAGLNYKIEILFIALVSLISIGLEVVIYLFYGLSFFLVIPVLLLMAFLLYSYKMNGVCFINYFSVCSSGQFTKYSNSVARVNAVYNQRK